MKIVATIIEVNTGVAICRGMRIDADTPYIATWVAPSGVHLVSEPSATKQAAVDDLVHQVRGLTADSHWNTVEDVEIEI